MTNYGKVAVLYGGCSSEREVSLKSGAAVLAALLAKGVQADGIDVGTNIAQRLIDGNYDRVFVALHGRLGEDGSMQGLLDVLGLPYTGSGVSASALAMNKLLSKALWATTGILTPEWRMVDSELDLESAVQALGFPLILKPIAEGSSIGVVKVKTQAELVSAYLSAKAHGRVLAERCIIGEELTCAILGKEALPVIRLETPHDIYDYEAKYLLATTQYHCPAGLKPEDEREVRRISLQAFNDLGAKGWGRIDLMREPSGRIYVLELNTVPGMTDHSLVPMAARAHGLSFEDLVLKILDELGDKPCS